MSGKNQGFRTIEFSDPRFEHEGLRQIVVKSRALERRADITVFVPAGNPPTHTLLILLHGVYGSHWSWALRTGVHRIAQQMIVVHEIEPMVIAMPSDGLRADGSGYLPHAGEDAERWIVEEVVAATKMVAPCLVANTQLAIGGLSMGGYGALRLGAKYAALFTAISTHSAITHVDQMVNFVEEPLESYRELSEDDDLDPLYWLRKNRAILPRLRFDCGSSDSLAAVNRQLHAALDQEKISHQYEELDGGHEWSYWERNVPRTLRFASRPLII